jgi:hypothetical protein
MKARSTSKWLLEMSKNGWDKDQKPQTSSETISNAEFELYDILRNMMMLTFLISMILVIMGKMGLKMTKKEKAKKA